MRLTYTLSFDEYRCANLLWLKYGRGKPVFQALLTTWLGPAIGGVFWAAGIYLLLAAPAYRAAAVAMFGIGGAAFSLPISHRHTHRRLYKLQDLANRELTAEIAEDGIHLTRSDGKVDTRYDWSAFSCYADDSVLLVLFPGRLTFVTLPLRVLSPEELAEVRRLVETHVKRSG
jgi:hypothetical protein